jgi:hypothetical protein
LLIVGFGSFHSVEGLDAFVDVEGFSGPGGLDRLGVGVPEGVDFSDVLPRGLVVAESVGEGDVGVPVLAWSAVGEGELPAISGVGDRDAAFVDGGVVELTEQDQILQIGRTAGRPGLNVVGFEVSGLAAAGVLADAVSDHQGAALGAADEAAGAAEGEGFAGGDDRGE